MTKTVLIVDDSAMMRKIVINNLAAAGLVVKVIEAANGKEECESCEPVSTRCGNLERDAVKKRNHRGRQEKSFP